MVGAIDHVERAFTMATDYLKTSYLPKIFTERTSQVGERKTDQQIHDAKTFVHSSQYDKRTTTKTVIEDKNWVVEKYDQNGKLIRLTPPGYVPFGRLVHSILV